MTSHDEIQDLLGAYVVDAVDADEREQIDAHLADCPRCRAEVDELREVTALLANSGEPAPTGVWDRIVASFEETPPPLRISVADVTPPRRRAATLLLAAAILVVVGLIGFAIGESTGRSNDEADLAAAAAAAMDTPGTRRAELATADAVAVAEAVVAPDGAGYLLGGDLPALAAGIYQLWGVTNDGSVISLGVLGEPGIMAFHVDASVERLMITEEVRPVARTANAPLLQGNLA